MASINVLVTPLARGGYSRRCALVLPGLTSFTMPSSYAHKHGFLTIPTPCRYSPWLLFSAALCVLWDCATASRELQSSWQVTSTSHMKSWNGDAQVLIT